MAFTREAVFMKWDYTGGNPAYKRAFVVLQNHYQGGVQDKPASYQRSVMDNSLLIVRASSKPRKPSCVVLGEDSPSGTLNDGSEDIQKGSIADLKRAWEATDLQVLFFEDTSYWEAEMTGSWPPMLEYDPLRQYAMIPIRLEEK